jgi:hypothetical protein
MAIAVAAALIAIWQAREARGARKAAKEQVTTGKDTLEEVKRQSAAAEKSATAAMVALGASERAAAAAEESAVEARRANAFAREKDERDRADREAEQHKHDAPKFTVDEQMRTELTVTMLDGPHEVDVTMERAQIVSIDGEHLEVPITLANDQRTYRLSRNGTCMMLLDMEAETAMSDVRLLLSSKEVGTDRTWLWQQDISYWGPNRSGTRI